MKHILSLWLLLSACTAHAAVFVSFDYPVTELTNGVVLFLDPILDTSITGDTQAHVTIEMPQLDGVLLLRVGADWATNRISQMDQVAQLDFQDSKARKVTSWNTQIAQPKTGKLTPAKKSKPKIKPVRKTMPPPLPQ